MWQTITFILTAATLILIVTTALLYRLVRPLGDRVLSLSKQSQQRTLGRDELKRILVYKELEHIAIAYEDSEGGKIIRKMLKYYE